jgi:hypothetical protein
MLKEDKRRSLNLILATMNKIRRCITCGKRRHMRLVDSGGPQEQCTLECHTCFDARKWGIIRHSLSAIGFEVKV